MQNMNAHVVDICYLELLRVGSVLWYVFDLSSLFCKEGCMFDIYFNILFISYRNLVGCVQNFKKLLNIYPVKKTSVFGNEVHSFKLLVYSYFVLKLLKLLTLFWIYSIKEREVLKEVLKQALACKSRLTELVDFALAYSDKDLSVLVEKLTTALKVS